LRLACMSARKCNVFEMSNYPDGMTSRDWAHIDGIEHHEDCPQYEDFDMDCECDTLYPSKYDIELEKLGL